MSKKETKIKNKFVSAQEILKAKGMDSKAQEEAERMGSPKDQ